MSLLEMGGKRFTIPAGEAFLGSDAGCAVAVSGALPRHAKLKGLPDGQVVIAKAVPEAEILINGVRLGADPTPLLHGDKVEVAGSELTFVDERRSGSTQYVQAMNVGQAMAQAKAEVKAGKATSNTGGRIVSLTDGREYAIAGASLVFGRDATCDVVVPGKDVSRRHAEIVQTPKGYLVVDSSTNGTFVNEERVEGQRLLARADVIRIGDENFRFYADTAPNPQPGPAGSAPSAAPPAQAPTAHGAERLKNTMHQAPGVPAGAGSGGGGGGGGNRQSGAVLAKFLVRAGSLKGQRLIVKTPLANIGRADYNDLVLPDESVSTTHAKLQRREGVWVLVDLDSTNGTFVDGERVQGETPLAPGANVKFGDVQLVFEPTDDAAGMAKGGGTRMIEVMKVPPKAAPAPAPTAPAPKPAPPPKAAPVPAVKPKPTVPKRPAGQPVAEQKKGKGCGGSAAVLVLAVIGALYWVLV